MGLLIVAGAGCLRLIQIRHQAGGLPPTMLEGIAYGVACLVGLFFCARLANRQTHILSRVPFGLCLTLLLCLFCLPFFVAMYYHHPLLHTLLTVAWLVIGAGIGEEFFYRGYVQSRVNEAFGRPFRFFGLKFGVGLLVSSVLFGFLHALNSVDYFEGRFTFAWGYGVAAFGVGLIYGSLREISESVVPGIVAHSLLDVLVRIPSLLP